MVFIKSNLIFMIRLAFIAYEPKMRALIISKLKENPMTGEFLRQIVDSMSLRESSDHLLPMHVNGSNGKIRKAHLPALINRNFISG